MVSLRYVLSYCNIFFRWHALNPRRSPRGCGDGSGLRVALFHFLHFFPLPLLPFFFSFLVVLFYSLFFILLWPLLSMCSKYFISINANGCISADANIAQQATGAMSWAFITAMKKNPQQSYVQLLNSIRDELATKYTQKPQLSCSHPLSKPCDVS